VVPYITAWSEVRPGEVDTGVTASAGIKGLPNDEAFGGQNALGGTEGCPRLRT
jgi:hypothetical protein